MTKRRWMIAGCLACTIGGHAGISSGATNYTGWLVRDAPSESRTSVILTVPVSYQRLWRAPEGVRCELRENQQYGQVNGLYGYWTSASGALPYDSYTGGGSSTVTARVEISRPGAGNQMLDPKEQLYVQCSLRPPADSAPWQVSAEPPPQSKGKPDPSYVKPGAVLQTSGQVPVGEALPK